MQVDIRHSPSYAVARCMLAPNEPIKAQPGSMMSMSLGMQVTAKAEGGILRSLGRMVGGENFNISTFTAPASGGWVDLIPEMVGDVFCVDVDPSTDFVLTKGAWLGNDGSIDISPDASISGMFAGEGLVVLKARGQGQLIGTTYGAIDVHSLKDGEGLIIDTGHLVAWESSVRMRTMKVGGMLNSWKSKEGLVVEVFGPGDVITQSRVPNVVTQTTGSNNNFGVGSLLGG
jgi:uncharacterized protein (TIGR00266 family)